MSLKLGNTPIAGISTHTNVNAHSLFDFKWADHRLNEVSWLEASTFSWHSGGVYVTAYNHLVADLQGTTAETETIGSYTVTFYRATDGHKIVLADQETTVLNIYNETGISWYYILDTENTRFKLPRTKFGFEGLRTNVGDTIAESSPNITGNFQGSIKSDLSGGGDGNAFGTGYTTEGTTYAYAFGNLGTTNGINFDASRSSSTYQNNAPVQERATQMYLYFYVGDYSQTATEQTAGINSELFNGKADVDLSNVPNSKGILTESYVNGTSWYRVYSDGWCEQGGITGSGISTIQLLQSFTNTNYIVFGNVIGISANEAAYTGQVTIYTKTETSFSFPVSSSYKRQWQACGYIR